MSDKSADGRANKEVSPRNARRKKGKGDKTPVLHQHGSQAEKKAVEKWLRKSGYPLEMEVARAFQQGGFYPIQSGYYEDPDTGKPRELDVSAEWANNDFGLHLRLTFPIQCKKSSLPWVVFCSGYEPSSLGRNVFSNVIGSPMGTMFLIRATATSEELNHHPFLLGPHWTAYGVTEGLTMGEDSPYEAAMTVIKASLAVKGRLAPQYPSEPISHLVIPVIVVDSALYACYLNQAGEQETTLIDKALLLWQHPGSSRQPSPIFVVARGAVSAFAAEAGAFRDSLVTLGGGVLREMAQRWYTERAQAIRAEEEAAINEALSLSNDR